MAMEYIQRMGKTEKDAGHTKHAGEGRIGEKAPDNMLMFAAEYIIDWNGTRAYKTVYGVDDTTAAPAASRLTRNSKVVAEIDRLLKASRASREARRERITEELEKIAFNDLESDFITDKDGKLIEVSRRDRIRALELLGKTEAMFTDKIDHSGSVRVVASEVDERL